MPQQFTQEMARGGRSSGFGTTSSDRHEGKIPPASAFRRTATKFIAPLENAGNGQVMIQRQQSRAVTPSSTSRSSQKASGKTKTAAKGMSMDEVMKDLLLLEEQQKSAQRKLANIKLMKQQKTQQRAQVEQILHSLRFSNSRRREQLNLSRQSLQLQTRNFLAAKLKASDSSTNLKNFNAKLKKALETANFLTGYRNQTDKLLCRLQFSVSALSNRQKEAEACLEEPRATLTKERHREEELTQSLRSLEREARQFVKNAAHCRSQLKDLDIDLRNAQSTETRAEFSLSERKRAIERLNAGYEEELDVKKKQLEDSLSALSDRKTFALSLKDGAATSQAKLDSLKAEAGRIELKTEATENGDVERQILRLQQHVAELEENHRCELEASEQLALNCKNLHETMVELNRKSLGNDTSAKEIKERSEQLLEQETNRRTTYETVLSKEQEERSRLMTLRQSVEKIESGMHENAKNMHELRLQRAALKSSHLEKKGSVEKELQEVEEAIRKEEQIVLNLESSGRKERDEVKSTLEAAELQFKKVHDEKSSLVKKKAEITYLLDDIEMEHSISLEKTLSTTADLLQKYPLLNDLDFSFQEGSDAEDQIPMILAPCRDNCTSKLDKAKIERAERLFVVKERLKKERERELEKQKMLELERLEREREVERQKLLDIEKHEKERERQRLHEIEERKKKEELERQKRLEIEKGEQERERQRVREIEKREKEEELERQKLREIEKREKEEEIRKKILESEKREKERAMEKQKMLDIDEKRKRAYDEEKIRTEKEHRKIGKKVAFKDDQVESVSQKERQSDFANKEKTYSKRKDRDDIEYKRKRLSVGSSRRNAQEEEQIWGVRDDGSSTKGQDTTDTYKPRSDKDGQHRQKRFSSDSVVSEARSLDERKKRDYDGKSKMSTKREIKDNHGRSSSATKRRSLDAKNTSSKRLSDDKNDLREGREILAVKEGTLSELSDFDDGMSLTAKSVGSSSTRRSRKKTAGKSSSRKSTFSADSNKFNEDDFFSFDPDSTSKAEEATVTSEQVRKSRSHSRSKRPKHERQSSIHLLDTPKSKGSSAPVTKRPSSRESRDAGQSDRRPSSKTHRKRKDKASRSQASNKSGFDFGFLF